MFPLSFVILLLNLLILGFRLLTLVNEFLLLLGDVGLHLLHLHLLLFVSFAQLCDFTSKFHELVFSLVKGGVFVFNIIH